MKKLLFMIESLSGGGAERVLTDLVKNIDKKKFDVTVMTVVDTGVYKDEIKSACKYRSILPNVDGTKNIFRKLLYKCKYKIIYRLPERMVYMWSVREKYDIEVAFIEGFVTKIISSSTNNVSKKIAWVHVDPINRDYADCFYRNLQHQINSYKRFNKIICVSKSVAKAFTQKFNLKENVMTRYNPIDSKFIRKMSLENITMPNFNGIKLVAVGRLVEQKGFDRLIKIARILKKDRYNFQIWIIGEGENHKQLLEMIKKYDVEENIKLLGFNRNPYAFMRNSDIFICSSRAEGYSLVIAEAMILGLPIISTDCAGPNELLGFGKYGLLVENNLEALYKGITKLINDKDLITRYSVLSKERVSFFNLEQAILDIENIF